MMAEGEFYRTDDFELGNGCYRIRIVLPDGNHKWVTIELKPLPVNLLEPHPVVQRLFNQKRAEALYNDWHWLAASEPRVNFRSGKALHYVWEGQHRLWGIKKHGIKEWMFMVYYDVPNDAMLAFLQGKLGDVRQWHIIDRFKLRLVEEEPVAMSITHLLSVYGVEITWNNQTGGYSCVGEIEALFLRDVDALDKTIQTIEGAWKLVPGARGQSIVKAIGFFWSSYPDADLELLIGQLQSVHQISSLMTRAREGARDYAVTPAAMLALLLKRDFYNTAQKRQSLKLGPLQLPPGTKNPDPRSRPS